MWSVKLKTLKKKTDFKKNDFIIHVAPSEIRWLTTIAAIDLEGIARFEIETRLFNIWSQTETFFDWLWKEFEMMKIAADEGSGEATNKRVLDARCDHSSVSR